MSKFRWKIYSRSSGWASARDGLGERRETRESNADLWRCFGEASSSDPRQVGAPQSTARGGFPSIQERLTAILGIAAKIFVAVSLLLASAN